MLQFGDDKPQKWVYSEGAYCCTAVNIGLPIKEACFVST